VSVYNFIYHLTLAATHSHSRESANISKILQQDSTDIWKGKRTGTNNFNCKSTYHTQETYTHT